MRNIKNKVKRNKSTSIVKGRGTTKVGSPTAGAGITTQRPTQTASLLPKVSSTDGIFAAHKFAEPLQKPGLAFPNSTPDNEKGGKFKESMGKVSKAIGAAGKFAFNVATNPKTSQAISIASDVAQNFVDVDQDSNFQGQQAVGDALMSSGNPYAMAAGAAFKALSVVDQATGMGINTIDKKQASAAGLSKGERLLNNVLGFLPGNPVAWLASSKMSEATEMTEETKQLSGAFGGSVGDVSTASSMGGNRYLFGKDKINNLITKANRDNQLLTELGRTNTQRKQSDYGNDIAQQNLNRYAGNTYNSNRIGKHGFKLMSVAEIRQLLESRKESEVQSFQNGGVIGVDVNVIAEGKYHAHRNHLEDVSEELSDLTKKGIPVITHSEGGEIEQVAEIEKKELIFRLEVTQKLEELYKDGSDEAMIEAGKLVAVEIIENTQDNSGEVLDNE